MSKTIHGFKGAILCAAVLGVTIAVCGAAEPQKNRTALGGQETRDNLDSHRKRRTGNDPARVVFNNRSGERY
ncbi:MAG: hypothetical protein ACP5MG_07060 [Verrucomicrobiia bacterium]